MNETKSTTCCELLTLFQRYYLKKFGVDGVILFNDMELNEEFRAVFLLTKSLFTYLTKKNKLCEKCEREWKNLKGS